MLFFFCHVPKFLYLLPCLGRGHLLTPTFADPALTHRNRPSLWRCQAPSLPHSEYPTLQPIVPTSYPSATPSEVPSPAPSEYETDNHRALRSLYEATNGASWQHKDNWLMGLPCENGWYGVTCENHDVDLQVRFFFLRAVVMWWWWGLLLRRSSRTPMVVGDIGV